MPKGVGERESAWGCGEPPRHIRRRQSPSHSSNCPLRPDSRTKFRLQSFSTWLVCRASTVRLPTTSPAACLQMSGIRGRPLLLAQETKGKHHSRALFATTLDPNPYTINAKESSAFRDKPTTMKGPYMGYEHRRIRITTSRALFQHHYSQRSPPALHHHHRLEVMIQHQNSTISRS